MQNTEITIGYKEAENKLTTLESIISFSAIKLEGEFIMTLTKSSFALFKNKILNDFCNFHEIKIKKEQIEICTEFIIEGKYNTIIVREDYPIKCTIKIKM